MGHKSIKELEVASTGCWHWSLLAGQTLGSGASLAVSPAPRMRGLPPSREPWVLEPA